jgi:hypothetical protein
MEVKPKGDEGDPKEPIVEDPEATPKEPGVEGKDVKPPAGEEEPEDPKPSDKDVFDVGYGKGAAKKQKELLKRLGLKDEAELDAFVKARAKAAEEEAKKSGNGELHARIKALEAQNESLNTYFETEWEKVGKELAKADKDYHATVEGADIPAKEKLKLANAALKLFTKNRKKTVDDPLNPGKKKRSKGFLDWWKEQGYTSDPTDKDEENYKNIHRIK